jgi:hypothetical protein
MLFMSKFLFACQSHQLYVKTMLCGSQLLFVCQNHALWVEAIICVSQIAISFYEVAMLFMSKFLFACQSHGLYVIYVDGKGLSRRDANFCIYVNVIETVCMCMYIDIYGCV